MERYPVVILDRPIRIFNFKPLPLLCVIVATLVTLRLASYIDSTWSIGAMPVNLLFFIICYSFIIANVKALELKPLKWWLRRLSYHGEPLPAYLPGQPLAPVITFAETPRAPNLSNHFKPTPATDYSCHCLKLNNIDLQSLDSLQRLKIADALVDFASEHAGGMQIYSPPDWGQSSEEREFYIVIKAPIQDIPEGSNQVPLPPRFEKLARKISKIGLSLEHVGKAEVRQLLFAQLSPSHCAISHSDEGGAEDNDAAENGAQEAVKNATARDARLFMPTASDDDLLSLCVAGFEHRPRYISIDDKFVATIHLEDLPREMSFGLFSKIFDLECQLSFSMYLRPCNLPALKRQALLNLKLGTTMKAYGPITPPEHLSQIKTFCETEIGATDVGASVTVYADTLAQLEQSLVAVERAVHRMGGTVSNSFNEQLEAFIAGLPICEDRRHNSHVITSAAAAKFVPFL